MHSFRSPALLVLALAGTAHAADKPKETPASGWSGSVFAGAAYVPDFEGSRTSHAGPLLGVETSYRTQDRGIFGFGSQGLNWRIEQGSSSIGIGLSAEGGRSDGEHGGLGGTGLRQGSERLKGLGDIRSTPVVALFGSTTLGPVPLQASIRTATRSHKGTLVDVGSPLSWNLTDRLSLSVSPGFTWADGRYMQAFFGVTDAQSAASGRRTFKAGAGIKSAQLGTGLEFEIDKHWSMAGGVQVKRLMGDAADSPVTEKKIQTSGMLSLQYRF
jgi:outer membrane scaffolding protein for murein synthesis (MipA/OmpV family)